MPAIPEAALAIPAGTSVAAATLAAAEILAEVAEEMAGRVLDRIIHGLIPGEAQARTGLRVVLAYASGYVRRPMHYDSGLVDNPGYDNFPVVDCRDGKTSLLRHE